MDNLAAKMMTSRKGMMAVMAVPKSDPWYPDLLKACPERRAPESLLALGSLDNLKNKKLPLFCSVRCPGSLILKTYDLMQQLREAGVTVVGGFHSPMDKECLNLLLRGTQPVIICPARSIERMRVPREWREPPTRPDVTRSVAPGQGRDQPLT